MAARSLRSEIASAFITGRPNRLRTAATRSGVSLPCSCSRSGLSASMAAARSASLASTDSATFWARPRTCAPSARAASWSMWRGEGGKNTKPDHVGAGLQRHLERVGCAQPADFDQEGRHCRFVRPTRSSVLTSLHLKWFQIDFATTIHYARKSRSASSNGRCDSQAADFAPRESPRLSALTSAGTSRDAASHDDGDAEQVASRSRGGWHAQRFAH